MHHRDFSMEMKPSDEDIYDSMRLSREAYHPPSKALDAQYTHTRDHKEKAIIERHMRNALFDTHGAPVVHAPIKCDPPVKYPITPSSHESLYAGNFPRREDFMKPEFKGLGAPQSMRCDCLLHEYELTPENLNIDLLEDSPELVELCIGKHPYYLRNNELLKFQILDNIIHKPNSPFAKFYIISFLETNMRGTEYMSRFPYNIFIRLCDNVAEYKRLPVAYLNDGLIEEYRKEYNVYATVMAFIEWKTPMMQNMFRAVLNRLLILVADPHYKPVMSKVRVKICDLMNRVALNDPEYYYTIELVERICDVCAPCEYPIKNLPLRYLSLCTDILIAKSINNIEYIPEVLYTHSMLIAYIKADFRNYYSLNSSRRTKDLYETFVTMRKEYEVKHNFEPYDHVHASGDMQNLDDFQDIEFS